MNAPGWFTCLANLFQILIDLYRRFRMSTPNPFPSPLPAGVPITAHNVLLMFGSDFIQGLGAPAKAALATVIADKADPALTQGAVVAAAGQLVGDGVMTLEQAVTQLAQLAGYGLVKLEAAVVPVAPASTPAAPATPAS